MYYTNIKIMTNFQKQVLELIELNYSISEISLELNRPMSSVGSVLVRFNITNYKKLNQNNVNNDYFDDINTENKAYLLEFFIADGYLHSRSNRFGINIQENDKNILEIANKDICPERTIYTNNRTTNEIKRMNQCVLRWSSENMKNIFINKYNITPNKTYCINFEFPFEEIPDYLISHFIRGFIDGDGNFKKIGGSLTMVGTSKLFLNQIGKYISNLTEGIEYNIKEIQGKTVKYYVLSFNMFRTNKPEKILQIYNYLYKDSTIFLQRKKDIIESYLKYRGKL